MPLNDPAAYGGQSGTFSLDSLLKMFKAIQTDEGLLDTAIRAGQKGVAPQLPPPSNVPNQPAVGEAGLLQQGAFQDILDPAIGEGIPGLGNPGQSIALNPPGALPIDPQVAGVGIPPVGQPRTGLTPQQSQVLNSLSARPQQKPLRGVTPQRPASNIQTSGIPIGDKQTPRLTLAQLIGA